MRETPVKIFCLMLSLLILSACSPSDPEQQVRNNIESIKTAISAKDAGDIKAHIGEHFRGNRMLDREQLYRFSVATFLQHGAVTVAVPTLEIEVLDDYSATFSGTALLTSTDANRWLPEDGRLVRFDGRWQNIDGSWLLVSLNWE